LREAVDIPDGPAVVRYPKAAVGPSIPAVDRIGEVDLLVRTGRPDLLLVPVGPTAAVAVEAAAGASANWDTAGVTVADPRWPVPVPPALVRLAAAHRRVVTIEDCGRTGGFGALFGQALQDAGVAVPMRSLGIPREFLPHGSRQTVLAELGLTAAGIVRAVAALRYSGERANLD
jgi:1-deoxy-D-xylulose-5-phosphate synthase